MIRVVTATDPGRERDRNEDAVLAGSLDDGSWVVVVCDGMGGHEAGDVASSTAARRIYQEVNARLDDPDVTAVLAGALHAAHHQVLHDAAERDVDMGTTAVVARVVGEQLFFAWIGDSRLYHFHQGELVGHSVDHTVIQLLIERGELDPDENHEDHPDAHVLTQAIGGDVDLLPSVGEATLRPGDRVVICSDGLHDLVTPAETGSLLVGPFDGLADVLVAEANDRGGHDNITVAVIGFEEGDEIAGRKHLDGGPDVPGGAEPSAVSRQPSAGAGPASVSPPDPAALAAPPPTTAAERTTPVEAPRRSASGGRITLPDEPLPVKSGKTAAAAATSSETPSRSAFPAVAVLVIAVAGVAALLAAGAVFLMMRAP